MGDLVVIGSGIAGHSAALELLRQAPGTIVQIIGAETGPPYDRPPLSKEFLLAATPKVPFLGQSEIYGEAIELRDGLTATAIDRAHHVVTLSDGSKVAYEKLLVATGSRLRRLPLRQADMRRVFYLRTVEDACRLRTALHTYRRIAIIGGGFIGLEIAAAARQLDCEVTVVEQAPMLLSRGATPVLAGYLRDLHIERGAEVRLDAAVEGVQVDRDGVTLRWPDGQLRADIVVVGIGITPNMELAAEAGLAVDDGILVDQRCRTSDEAIFAAGEVTNHPIGTLDLRARTESWSAAAGQGVVAARNMLGVESSFDELPWFWSDQYDINLQCLGLPARASRHMQIGDIALGRWMRIGLDHNGRLVGAECVNMGREMSALRRADRNRQPVPPALLDRAEPSGVEGVAASLSGAPPIGDVQC
jgi:3-phenylpropionate/trans-cinnamate dioxygenase ferredoxin reductase subunit/anthranilate 1,2-dioxygenase ferredoxin reductase subunit